MSRIKRTAAGVLGALFGLVGLSAIAGVLITATVTPAIALSGLAAKSGIDLFDSLPDELRIDTLMLPTVIYAKGDDGKQHEITRFYEQNRSPVQYDEIAPVMIDAVLSSEDNRYFNHGGVDLLGTTRAIAGNLVGKDVSGGSSISQQYVKNVLLQQCETITDQKKRSDCINDANGSTGTEGLKRKLQEMRYSISLEKQFSKEDILLGYLNIASFGGVTYGIDAAARRYFSVPASKLNLSQAAALAGMVQEPNAFRLDLPDSESNGKANGYKLTKDRQLTVLYNMFNDGKITREQYDKAVEAPIKPKISDRLTGCSAAKGEEYFCQLVKDQLLSDPVFGEKPDDRRNLLNRGGMKVYTTLDPKMQKTAVESMKNLVPTKMDKMKLGSATVSIEVDTGRILSIAQNTKFSEDPTVIDKDPDSYSSLVFAADNTYGVRSQGFPIGSTFKLFTLIDWLEEGHSVREVLDARNPQDKRWTTQCHGTPVVAGSHVGNFGQDFGRVSDILDFTASSLNSGYLAMAEQLDICDIMDTAEKMGAVMGNGMKPGNQLTDSGEWVYSPQVGNVIGPSNHSPLAIAGAYATVANEGVLCRPHAIDRIVMPDGSKHALPDSECKRVIPKKVAATAAFALAGVTNNGSGTGANPWDGTETVGKTGSHEQSQTWMMQTSTKVATGAWLGNYEGEADLWSRGLSDIRYTLSKDLMARADELYPAKDFPDPDKDLTKTIYNDLPSVVGLSIDDATQRLQDAGFGVTVGKEINGSEAKGTVTQQSPGAGSVVGFPQVTITPSNGKGAPVPKVVGMSRADAISALRDAGFNSLSERCKEDKKATGQGSVTAVSPAAGTIAPPGTSVTINVTKPKC